MKTHELKCWPKQFNNILSGHKTFEIRRNDRDFAVGDQLLLKEWDPDTEEYSGRGVSVNVTYIMRNAEFGLQEGFVAMSIDVVAMHPAASGRDPKSRRMGLMDGEAFSVLDD